MERGADRCESDHVAGMDRYANRFMVLLIDFDGNAERLSDSKNRVPERLTERFFILAYCLLSAAVPSRPPRPMVSTADDGTITIEPFSFMAS